MSWSVYLPSREAASRNYCRTVGRRQPTEQTSMNEISERPLLAATGQETRLKVCGLLAVVGIAAVTVAGTLFNASHPLAGTTLLAIGAAVLLAALFTALRRIACPQCK